MYVTSTYIIIYTKIPSVNFVAAVVVVDDAAAARHSKYQVVDNCCLSHLSLQPSHKLPHSHLSVAPGTGDRRARPMPSRSPDPQQLGTSSAPPDSRQDRNI